MQSDIAQTHLTRLLRMQNADGGWGFSANRESRVESTAWALLALSELDPGNKSDETINRGLRFLTDSQLEGGSWAAGPDGRIGCWVTSLACWALLAHPEHRSKLLRGVRWLEEDRPGDSGFWFRTMRKFTERKKINAQSAAYSGWSWTVGTASWVEPTCYALIVLQRSSTAASAASRDKRRNTAEAMLLDRMCPGGGWNCGNPKVYGVAGQPQIGPTVWALIALRENPERIENRQSLDWLENKQREIKSPDSLALAQIAFNLYGRSNFESAKRLQTLEESDDLPVTVPAVAWTILSLSESQRWLNSASSSAT